MDVGGFIGRSSTDPSYLKRFYFPVKTIHQFNFVCFPVSLNNLCNAIAIDVGLMFHFQINFLFVSFLNTNIGFPLHHKNLCTFDFKSIHNGYSTLHSRSPRSYYANIRWTGLG